MDLQETYGRKEVQDAHGDLFVANSDVDGTVSEFAPGGTTPIATLTGVSEATALAFDALGDLFVANFFDNTVSEFAPGSTSPTNTLTGLNAPSALVLQPQIKSRRVGRIDG